MCCGTRVRGSVPQPQSSSLALPCQILVSVDGCQSLAAFGSCIHRMRAPSRRPITPAGTAGKRVSSGHNRRRRLATRRCVTKRAGTTAVAPATIEWQQCLLRLHFFDTLSPVRITAPGAFFSENSSPFLRRSGQFLHIFRLFFSMWPFFIRVIMFYAFPLATDDIQTFTT